jgi:glycosyltransferase involved in cell wall biosynthesis
MRIALDLQTVQGGNRYRGIGRYALNLAQAIARNRGDHDVMVVLSDLFPDTLEPIRSAFAGLVPASSFHVFHAVGPVRASANGNDWRRAASEHLREAFLASLRPDVTHVSSPFEGYLDDVVTSIGKWTAGITTVTLFDLIPYVNQDAYLGDPGVRSHYLENLTNVERANAWLTISDWSRNEAQRLLGMPSSALSNISAAVDPIFLATSVSSSERSDLERRFGLAREFVMYSGGADPRKNLHRLIKAFAEIGFAARRRHQLLLVGRFAEAEVAALRTTAFRAGLGPDELVLTGFVADKDLVALYRLCSLFVLPSTHEGFGLPILEAMACGAPVIGANATSIPELIRTPEALFDPFDVSSIAGAIARALGDRDLLDELRSRGLTVSKEYSWDVTAQRAIRAFEAAANGRLVDALESKGSDRAIDGLIDAIVPSKTKTPASGRDLLVSARAISRNHPE